MSLLLLNFGPKAPDRDLMDFLVPPFLRLTVPLGFQMLIELSF
jgi:hypothetical protein